MQKYSKKNSRRIPRNRKFDLVHGKEANPLKYAKDTCHPLENIASVFCRKLSSCLSQVTLTSFETVHRRACLTCTFCLRESVLLNENPRRKKYETAGSKLRDGGEKSNARVSRANAFTPFSVPLFFMFISSRMLPEILIQSREMKTATV